jgi:hypothetical protein
LELVKAVAFVSPDDDELDSGRWPGTVVRIRFAVIPCRIFVFWWFWN